VTVVDLIKITTTLQNLIITEVILGEGKAFDKFEFTKGDGSSTMETLADFLDLTLA